MRSVLFDYTKFGFAQLRPPLKRRGPALLYILLRLNQPSTRPLQRQQKELRGREQNMGAQVGLRTTERAHRLIFSDLIAWANYPPAALGVPLSLAGIPALENHREISRAKTPHLFFSPYPSAALKSVASPACNTNTLDRPCRAWPP